MVSAHPVVRADLRERLGASGRRRGTENEPFLHTLEFGAALLHAHPPWFRLVAREPGILDSVPRIALAVNRNEVRVAVPAVHLSPVEHADTVAKRSIRANVESRATLAHGRVLHEVPAPSQTVLVDRGVEPALLDLVEGALQAAFGPGDNVEQTRNHVARRGKVRASRSDQQLTPWMDVLARTEHGHAMVQVARVVTNREQRTRERGQARGVGKQLVERGRPPLEHRLVELESREAAVKYLMVLEVEQRSLETRARRQQLRLKSLVRDLRLVEGGYAFERSLHDDAPHISQERGHLLQAKLVA